MRTALVMGLGALLLLGGWPVDAAPVGYAAWRSMYTGAAGPQPLVRGRALGSVLGGVTMAHSATPGTVNIGDVVEWRLSLVNRSTFGTVESRVDAEYTNPVGEHVTQAAVTPLTILGAITDVRLRLYVADGCAFRAGIDQFAVGPYLGGEVPTEPAVGVDDEGRVYLLVDYGTVPQGKALSVRWTTLVVGTSAPSSGLVALYDDGRAHMLTGPPAPPTSAPSE